MGSGYHDSPWRHDGGQIWEQGSAVHVCGENAWRQSACRGCKAHWPVTNNFTALCYCTVYLLWSAARLICIALADHHDVQHVLRLRNAAGNLLPCMAAVRWPRHAWIADHTALRSCHWGKRQNSIHQAAVHEGLLCCGVRSKLL